MSWYNSFALVSLVVCLVSLSFHLVRLLRFGSPKDYSRRRGNISSAIAYSFVGAMSPVKKESAYLHLPTYTAGLLYHIGTFVSIALFVAVFFNTHFEGVVLWSLVGLLAVSGTCGLGILVKRMVIKIIRSLSHPDDYVSNLLVTIFQTCTLIVLLNESFTAIYFLWVGVLLLYLPLGKLKHALYFFAARYQLGFFYGWRAIWPPEKL